MTTRRAFMRLTGGGVAGGVLMRGLPVALAGVLLGPRRARATVLETVDYVFPDPNTANGEPDPAVWTSSGSLVPRASAGQGLLIADPDNSSSLLYFHASAPLANPANVATLRALVKTPAIPDTSAAWDADHLAFRLILDDGIHHAELVLARDPVTHARQLLLLNAPTAAPIPFSWDNAFYNLYEIARLANGDFMVTATNNDPAATTPVQATKYAAAQLPPSLGTAFFAWGSGDTGGGSAFWQEVHGQVVSTLVHFDLDTKELEIELGATAAGNEIEWKGEITLPAGAAIDPVAEAVSIELASAGGILFETTIDAGSFLPHGNGGVRFKSPEGSTPQLDIKFKPRGGTLWEFKAEVENLPLTITDRTQITGTLTIGDKVGTQTVPLTDKGKRLVFKKA